MPLQVNNTNNNILFECQLDILRGESNIETYTEIRQYAHKWRMYCGDEGESGENYSFDNWIGVACWIQRYSYFLKSEVPLWGHHTLRPDNFAFFLYYKYPTLGIFFIWIKQIAMSISVLRDKRIDHYGNEYRDTDGLILGKLILMSFKMPITSWVWHKIVNKKWGCWQNAFRHYHSNNPNDIQKKILEVL